MISPDVITGKQATAIIPSLCLTCYWLIDPKYHFFWDSDSLIFIEILCQPCTGNLHIYDIKLDNVF